MLYTCEYFSIQELVPPELDRNVRDTLLWMLFDPLALVTLDRLRKRYGPIVVNNWAAGGDFQYSGFRPWDCPEGAEFSQHKFGRAFDCKFKLVTADEVRADLKKYPELPCFEYVLRVEEFPGMSWFHWDRGNWDRAAAGGQVFVFNPRG